MATRLGCSIWGEFVEDDITRLPSDYEARVTDDNRVFFVDHASERTKWESPLNGQRYRVENGLTYGWQKFQDEDNQLIYVDHLSQICSSVDPRLLSRAAYDFPLKYGIKDHTSISNHFRWLVKAEDVLKHENLEGKVMVVTGANCGLGYHTALVLAVRGAQVILACRNMNKAEKAVSKIRNAHAGANVECMCLDLASLQSISDFAREFIARDIPLHVLVCNAGVLSATLKYTSEGLEEHFGVNHLGHFYLCKLLLPSLLRSKPSRVVVVSSESHWYPTCYSSKLDMQSLCHPKLDTYRSITAYGASKLCNILFALEFDRRYVEKGVSCNVVHPGNLLPTAMSGKAGIFYRALFMLAKPFTKSVEQAASCIVYCAGHPSMQGVSGLYMHECWPVEPSMEAQDSQTASDLWDLSEQIIEDKTRVMVGER